ncbi:MAG: hypothetical protein GW949_05140 [Spirochaetales bacterium]|nr:hypothetical protein [Spirochaetales bacterium]
MTKIEDVAFGKMVCNGKVYRAPLVVYPDKVDGRWWRKDGMAFSPEDFDDILATKPEVVVLGVGYNAKVRVLDETIARIKEAGAECIVEDTPKAVERYTALGVTKKVVGAFSLF